MFGLHWDGAVEYQSRRVDRYAQALRSLRASGRTFECSCARRELATECPSGTRYPGTCRSGPRRSGPTATRFKMDDGAATEWIDHFQGRVACSPASLGDVIIRRRDGIYAYQLAAAVDDASQGITDVVRGADLLESTAWQIALQRALGAPTPRYGHLPLLTEPGGAKLAKSRRSVGLVAARASAQLLQILRLLKQEPPAALSGAPVNEVLDWAIAHWNRQALYAIRSLSLPDPD